MRHVFLSYCREDLDFAHDLENRLTLNGFTTWRDRILTAGDDWRAEIDFGIRDALAVIVVLSPVSIRSAYVNYEWAFALGSGIPVIAVLHTGISETQLPPQLKHLRCFDFSGGTRHPWNSLIDALQTLEDDLRPTTVHIPRDASPVMERALRSLDSIDEDERQAAIQSLGQMDEPRITEILAEAVRHPVRQVRIGIARLVAARKDARAIPALVEGLRSRDEAVKPWILETFGAAAVPQLLELLDEDDIWFRPNVYEALGALDDPRAIEALNTRLRDPDPVKRSSAASVLRSDPGNIPILLEMMQDSSPRVRSAAISALIRIAAKTGAQQNIFPTLLMALDDEEDQVVISAVLALGETGNPESVAPLLRAMLYNPSDQVCTFAKQAICKLEAAPLRELREAVSSPNPRVRERAIRFLSEWHDPEDVPLFLNGFKDDDFEVRWAALSAFSAAAKRAAVPTLIAILKDDGEHPNIVRSAVIDLGEIGDPAAVPALIECLQDEELADAAANSLYDIGTREARTAAKTWKAKSAGK